jgi:hypothetical protein
MTTNDDFDRIARAWLADGPTELADRVLDAALDDVHATRQRRRPLLHGRTPRMTLLVTAGARAAAAALATVAVLGGGALLLAGGAGPAAGPGASASPEPSPIVISNWPTYESKEYGISFGVPPGWTVSPAQPTGPLPMGPDEVLDRDGVARFIVQSVVAPTEPSFAPGVDPLLGRSYTWALYLADQASLPQPPGCDAAKASGYGPINVDGQDGFFIFSAACGYGRAIVSTGGRLYELTTIPGFADGVPSVVDLRLFEAWLSSVRLLPSAAVDMATMPVPSP